VAHGRTETESICRFMNTESAASYCTTVPYLLQEKKTLERDRKQNLLYFKNIFPFFL